jgi:putative two-component system response regulator
MNKATILVIDDQATALRVMERMLTDDYVVLTADSGERGLDIAKHKMPDLILLDMVMPELSGIEVCQHLAGDPLTRRIPVIFVTSMDDRHNEETGFRAGAVDYISKPPSPGIVRARVKVHLMKTRQARFVEAVASGKLADLDNIREAAKNLLDP